MAPPPWLTRPHATVLSMNRLGRADAAELVAGVASTIAGKRVARREPAAKVA